jgi:hypothetical protein
LLAAIHTCTSPAATPLAPVSVAVATTGWPITDGLGARPNVNTGVLLAMTIV